jgi:hypothetical protein
MFPGLYKYLLQKLLVFCSVYKDKKAGKTEHRNNFEAYSWTYRVMRTNTSQIQVNNINYEIIILREM